MCTSHQCDRMLRGCVGMLVIGAVFMVATFPIVASQAPRSAKRGIVRVPSDNPTDDSKWDSGTSAVNWYYNYGATPSNNFAKSLDFVPMLWGAGNTNDSAFLDSVLSQLKSGSNISYVMAFNEPDGGYSTGGSQVSPEVAAAAWIRQIEPLKAHNIKLGAPAVTGAPSGFTWLQHFLDACHGNCTFDFIPIHWYGNFEG